MGFAMCRLLDPYTPGGEPFHLGVALSLFLETINTRIDFVMILKRTHTPLRPIGNFTTSRCVLARTPPDHSYCDLGFLHSTCDQLSLTLAESCWGGRSPVIASPRVSPPPDALCHPRPDSSCLKIVIVQETPPTILLLKSLFKQCKATPPVILLLQSLCKKRYQGPFVPGANLATIGDSVQRESPSPLQVGVAFKGLPLSIVNEPQGLPPLLSDGFASWGSPSPIRMDFVSWRSPPCPGGPLLQVDGILPKGFPPSLQRMGFASRGSPSLSLSE